MKITPALMSRIRELVVPMARYSNDASFRTTLPDHRCTVAIRTDAAQGKIVITLTDIPAPNALLIMNEKKVIGYTHVGEPVFLADQAKD